MLPEGGLTTGAQTRGASPTCTKCGRQIAHVFLRNDRVQVITLSTNFPFMIRFFYEFPSLDSCLCL
jgi:hypothetical protein